MNPSNELLDMIRETQARVDALDAKCAALELRINPEPTPEYISAAQAGGMLNVSYPTLQTLPIARYPVGNSVQYRRDEVAAFLASRRES